MKITKAREYTLIRLALKPHGTRVLSLTTFEMRNGSGSQRFENVSGYLSLLTIWILSKGEFNCKIVIKLR